MQEKFIEWNRRGWIPGPKEEKKDYLRRVEAVDHHFSYPPQGIDEFLTDGDWQKARVHIAELYDISPDWIVAHYSDDELPFFQAAATWITEKEGTRIPLVQLKRRYTDKDSARTEILAHEAVHAARMAFDEPYFEEIFAYQTSRFFWRRWLGGLFAHSWESHLFIFLLIIPVAVEMALLYFPEGGWWQGLFWLPWLFFAYILGRLLFHRTLLFLALRRLKKLFPHLKKPWAVAVRLTDAELRGLAWLSKKRLKKALKEWGKDGLRWQFLHKFYLNS